MNNLAFFGRSFIAEKLLKKYKPVFILDNSPSFNNSYFHGIKVLKPTKKNISKIKKIIICVTSVDEVVNQIKYLNKKIKIIFPKQLNEFLKISKLKNFKFNGYISCGMPSLNIGNAKGGIYHIYEKGSKLAIKRLYRGNTHGLIIKNNFLYFTCDKSGIVKMTKNGHVLKKIKIAKNFRPHGIKIHNNFFIACSNRDQIVEINNQGKVINKFLISKKIKKYDVAQHHVNDLYVDKKNIYVSMFSITGDWKRGKFDGGILKISRKTNARKVIYNDLKLPHSIHKVKNSLLVLDSLNGNLKFSRFKKLGPLNGFVRGMDMFNNYIFIGESQNRNFSGIKNNNFPRSIDTRITIIDKNIGACRSLNLPKYISEIHSLVYAR